jgi:SAM-dependent methyltransferase
MKLTGERPIEGRTPAALVALHDAGYREVRARLGPGVVVDVGSGTGDATRSLAADGRHLVGVDYHAGTAASARRNGLTAMAADGAALPLRSRSVEHVCSSHLIEHFVHPDTHVAEVSRVLAAAGTAFFVTPNAPADVENPFHVSLFEPRALASLLGRFFDDVEVLGLDGDDVVQADFARRRRIAMRIAQIDHFGLRHRVPRRAYIALHGVARRVLYPVLALVTRHEPAITADRYAISRSIDAGTLALFAVARRPRARSTQPRRDGRGA